jgi:hypothetical protein
MYTKSVDDAYRGMHKGNDRFSTKKTPPRLLGAAKLLQVDSDLAAVDKRDEERAASHHEGERAENDEQDDSHSHGQTAQKSS